MSRIFRLLYCTRVALCPAKRRMLPIDLEGQPAANLIANKLLCSEPCMIGRWGATELAGILSVRDVHDMRSIWLKRWKVIAGEMRAATRWSPRIRRDMATASGFFPLTDKAFGRFADLMERDARELDVLGSWLAEEVRVRHFFPHATIVDIRDLRPEQNDPSWSKSLTGKRVLVVHPFQESIRSQYAKRALLFPGRDVLPEFELLTFRAVQTLGGHSDRFESWFEALDWMCGEIDKIDYDVAIIGAGAYGFPLAAHIKRSGKKAVHLGGATQIMFGIMGKRWESDVTLKPFVSAHWTRPLPSETPSAAKGVEDGCYW